EAFRKFKKIHGRGGWKLVLAGYAQNGIENEYIRQLASISDGNVQMLFNISREKIAELYSRCYATLFCARDEDWGFVPVEAMASRKPVISVNEGGPTESILDGKTGYLVNSTDEMAQRMELLAGNPEMAESMGRAGRKRVLGNFTKEMYLGKLGKIIRKTAKM
ncbi:MAG: glycosyltransferase, partial [Candidatus Micrarchaeia archaeon]